MRASRAPDSSLTETQNELVGPFHVWPEPVKTAVVPIPTHQRKRLQFVATDIVFVVFLATIAILRFDVIRSAAEPSGLDPGNWLAFGHALLGSQSRSSSIVYPPVIPLITVGFDAIWGPFLGTQVLAAVSSLMPSAGMYVLLRSSLGPRALLIAGLLAPSAATGEAAAWGGYPQLLGLGLLPMSIWALNRFIATSSLAWALATSIVLFLTLATSDLIGAAAIAVSVVFLPLRIVQLRKSERPSLRRLGAGVALGTASILVLAPIYVKLAGGVIHNQAAKGAISLTLENVSPYVDNVFKDDVRFWYLLLWIAILAPCVLIWRRDQPLVVVTASILVPATIALFVVGELRFAFLLPVVAVTGVGAWWATLASSRRLVAATLDKFLVAAAVVLLVVETYLGIGAYEQQVEWYEVLTPGVVAGLQQLEPTIPSNAKLAVSPGPGRAATQGWPFGWWVEGLLDRPTFYASTPGWLVFQDEHVRSDIANEIFDPSGGVSRAIAIAQEHGIEYIVVATGWLGYRAWISKGVLPDGSRVVVDTDSMLVIAVNG